MVTPTEYVTTDPPGRAPRPPLFVFTVYQHAHQRLDRLPLSTDRDVSQILLPTRGWVSNHPPAAVEEEPQGHPLQTLLHETPGHARPCASAQSWASMAAATYSREGDLSISCPGR